MRKYKKGRVGQKGSPSMVSDTEKMKITTINLPILYINLINVLLAEEGGIYPSRSELVRVALGEFLEKKIGVVKKMKSTVDSYLEDNGIKILREA